MVGPKKYSEMESDITSSILSSAAQPAKAVQVDLVTPILHQGPHPRLMEWVIFTSCCLSQAYISRCLLIGFKLVITCGEPQFLIVLISKWQSGQRNLWYYLEIERRGGGVTGMTWSVAHHMCSQAFNKSEDTNSRYWTGMVFWQIVGNECRLSLIM